MSMDYCNNDSEMTPGSSSDEAAGLHEQEATAADVPEVGMEQDVTTDPVYSKKCFVGRKFESYDDMMAMIDDLKAQSSTACI